MAVSVVTPPSGAVIALANAKAHLRVPDAVTLFDDDITAKVAAATAYAEQFCNRALLTQTWQLALDAFPNLIELPGGKPMSVTSVKYTDVDGTLQTLDASTYQTDLVSQIGRVVPRPGASWPSVLGGLNQVLVEYVVGYGDANTVPAPIVQAILLHLGDAWVNREAALDSRFYVINQAADNLLWPYRIVLP
jgi:uncharacterized phiE125 gp8 family phage protein